MEIGIYSVRQSIKRNVIRNADPFHSVMDNHCTTVAKSIIIIYTLSSSKQKHEDYKDAKQKRIQKYRNRKIQKTLIKYGKLFDR